jgi:hypothetical protein
MRVMVIVKATKDSEAGVLPSPKGLEDMGKYMEELVKAGVLLEFGGLLPTSQGKRVRFSGGRSTVIDGPFAESKELIAGYSILKVNSMEEAVEWVKRGPSPDQDSEIEIRKIFDPEDFGSNLTDEAKERGLRVRADLAQKKG